LGATFFIGANESLMPQDNITELKKRVPGGKYALARAIAERARQLQNGATPLTAVKVANPLSTAIEEILEGKVSFEFKENNEAEEAEVEPKDTDLLT
jgi:DNA-directed RNA polymerase subunit omega